MQKEKYNITLQVLVSEGMAARIRGLGEDLGINNDSTILRYLVKKGLDAVRKGG